MRTHFLNNTVTTLIISVFLFFTNTLLGAGFSTNYYLAAGFFYILYITQAYLLLYIAKSPQMFITLYGFTTMVKMLLSCVVLAGYHMFYASPTEPIEKIKFSLFFAITYFIYLIINTKTFFKNKHEKKKPKKSI